MLKRLQNPLFILCLLLWSQELQAATPCSVFLGQIEAVGLKPEHPLHKVVKRIVYGSHTGKFFDEAYLKALEIQKNEKINFVAAFARAAKFDLIPTKYDYLVPKSGPLVVTSNHPFGMADAFAIFEFLDRNRPGEVLGLATQMVLEFMPELAEGMIPVDLDAKSNRLAASRMAKHLAAGKVVALFPAGGVSKRINITDAVAIETPWQDGAAAYAVKYKTQVLPIHIEGSNTRLSDFLAWMEKLPPRAKIKDAGRVEKFRRKLRRVLIEIGRRGILAARPWENWRNSRDGFAVRVGEPYSYAEVETAGDDRSAQTDYLYQRYLDLRNQPE